MKDTDDLPGGHTQDRVWGKGSLTPFLPTPPRSQAPAARSSPVPTVRMCLGRSCPTPPRSMGVGEGTKLLLLAWFYWGPATTRGGLTRTEDSYDPGNAKGLRSPVPGARGSDKHSFYFTAGNFPFFERRVSIQEP